MLSPLQGYQLTQASQKGSEGTPRCVQIASGLGAWLRCHARVLLHAGLQCIVSQIELQAWPQGLSRVKDALLGVRKGLGRHS